MSANKGIHPLWRADGRELFYWQEPGDLVSVQLHYDASGVQAEAARLVLPPYVQIDGAPDGRREYASNADGQRFLLRQPFRAPRPPINVILNWTVASPK